MELPPSERSGRRAAAFARLSAANADRLSKLVDAQAPLIAFELRRDGFILWSDGNPRDAILASRGETEGRFVQEAYADMPEILEATARARRGETVTALLHVDGLALVTMLFPVADGDGFGVVGIALDAAALTDVLDTDLPPRPADGETPDDAGLSLHQARVACGLARGLALRDIGDRLDRSPSTISSHARAACRVLGLERTADLRIYGAEQGWHLLPDPAFDDPPKDR